MKTLTDSSSTGCGNGWCPDGTLVQFAINDVDVDVGSIVIINLLKANLGVPPDEEVCNVTDVANDRIIIGCNVAPRDSIGSFTIDLRYAIIN